MNQPSARRADEAMLEHLQHAAFNYFLAVTNPSNGLVADTNRQDAPCSIAVVGFALAAYPIAIEHGWIERDEARARALRVLRFFAGSDQSGGADATGFRGFYFHFLHMNTGARMWQSELSMIDTAWLIAGMLCAQSYYGGAGSAETELRDLAEALYRRVQWSWAQRDGGAMAHGWKPECGFLHYGWDGYSEALLLYVLGLGSPTHALTDASFRAWTLTYQWENLYGHEFLYAGPLFTHQFSHAWIDFREIQDPFMRAKDCDYFENTRRATYVQRDYAIRNPRGFAGYGEDCWSLSANDGPSIAPRSIAGRMQSFYGYAARSVPYGPDDGTIAGPSVLAALPFAPEIALPAARSLYVQGAQPGVLLRASGFNKSVAEPGQDYWISAGEFGLDQGMTLMMIENYRSDWFWQLNRTCPYLRTGLRRAGFRGGWL